MLHNPKWWFRRRQTSKMKNPKVLELGMRNHSSGAILEPEGGALSHFSWKVRDWLFCTSEHAAKPQFSINRSSENPKTFWDNAFDVIKKYLRVVSNISWAATPIQKLFSTLTWLRPPFLRQAYYESANKNHVLCRVCDTVRGFSSILFVWLLDTDIYGKGPEADPWALHKMWSLDAQRRACSVAPSYMS